MKNQQQQHVEEKQESNGIEVYLRIRPSPNPSGYFDQDDIDETQFIFQLPKQKHDSEDKNTNNGIVNNTRTKYGFKFNGILDYKATQEQVFNVIGAPAVKNVLDGFNSTVFAYGQTGSGKTFTITGGPERYADRGIIPRAISMLFDKLQNNKNGAFTCYVSYFELYNENGYDLLAGVEKDDSGDSNSISSGNNRSEISRIDDLPKVTMLEDEDGNYHFRNLSVNQVSSEEEALNLLFIGDTNRAIGETQMNQSSSRSHCIFTVMVEMRNSRSDTVIRSKLNLVDLAGSERVHKTNSSGQTLKEAQYINSSLFFLEMVIVALHERTKKGKENIHVPYRNSMMTSVLRDSLGGNCKTIMVATISPEAKQTDESISTCHFAQRVALVKNNAYINEELEPELVIRRLKTELKRVREEVKFLKGENGEEELSDENHQELERAIRDYLFDSEEGRELSIGTISLTKVQASYSIFKKIFVEAGKMREQEISSSSQNEIIQKLSKTIRQRDDEIKVLVEMVKRGKPPVEGIPDSKNHLSSERERKNVQIQEIVQTNVQGLSDVKICGVQQCRDRNTLADPSKAFTWFRERHSGEATIEENKELLQSRFLEAKRTGEVVKQAREAIQHHKSMIEKTRRCAAIEGIGRLGGSNDDESHLVEEESRRAIEGEKKVYQQAFQRLKELKTEIEHIKRLMEKGRIKLQRDFDIWYDKMCNPSETIGGNSPHTPDQRNIDFIPSEHSEETSVKNLAQHNDRSNFKLPPGARLTGNKETDDDIIAFYKAKEALTARSKARFNPSN